MYLQEKYRGKKSKWLAASENEYNYLGPFSFRFTCIMINAMQREPQEIRGLECPLAMSIVLDEKSDYELTIKMLFQFSRKPGMQ